MNRDCDVIPDRGLIEEERPVREFEAVPIFDAETGVVDHE